MKKYTVEFSAECEKRFHKLDNSVKKLILTWLNKNLENCENPRVHGKALIGNKKGLWRYRVGNYRILCNIDDEQITILVVDIGHRSEIYK